MKVSELTRGAVAEYCRIILEDQTETELQVLDAMKEAAIQYCTGYTGLTREELDEHEDITIAVMTLVSDMYDNRQMTVEKDKINPIAASALNLHSFNFVVPEDEE